jgi:hypothetical protein
VARIERCYCSVAVSVLGLSVPSRGTWQCPGARTTGVVGWDLLHEHRGQACGHLGIASVSRIMTPPKPANVFGESKRAAWNARSPLGTAGHGPLFSLGLWALEPRCHGMSPVSRVGFCCHGRFCLRWGCHAPVHNSITIGHPSTGRGGCLPRVQTWLPADKEAPLGSGTGECGKSGHEEGSGDSTDRVDP